MKVKIGDFLVYVMWVVIIAIGVIAGLCTYQNRFSAQVVSYLGILSSALLALFALQQTRIQKENVRIQMFDKRAKALWSIQKSKIILFNSKIDLQNLNDGTFNPNRELLRIENELNESIGVASCLFPKEIANDLQKVAAVFFKVSNRYRQMCNENVIYYITHPEWATEFDKMLLEANKSHLGCEASAVKDMIYSNTDNKIFINLKNFSESCKVYANTLEETKIIKVIQEFIDLSSVGK